MKMTKTKLSGLVLILIVIAGLCVLLNKRQWLFTPVYSQRKTATTFVNDIFNDNLAAAYAITDKPFKANNTAASFNSREGILVGNNNTIVFQSYATSKVRQTLTSKITNKTSGQSFTISIAFIPASGTGKVDSVYVYPTQ